MSQHNGCKTYCNWDAFNHASHALQLASITMIIFLCIIQCTKEQAVKGFYDRLTSHHVPPYPVAVVSRLCPEATQTLAAVSKHYCLPVVSD